MKRSTIKTKFTRLRVGLIAGIITMSAQLAAQAALDIFPGDTEGYAVLYEGAGSHNLTINTSPLPDGDTILGDVGLATQLSGDPTFQFNNPAVIRGDVNFAGTRAAAWHPSGGVLIGNTNFGVASVNTDMSAINALSQQMSLLSGTSAAISGNTVINASNGVYNATLDAEVFTLTGLSLANSQTLTIDGDLLGHNVILNFGTTAGLHIAGAISLTGGLTADNVFMNLYGGTFSTLSGGPTLQTAANKAEQEITYLIPNGNVNIDNVNIEGHLFGGDSADMQIVSGATVEIIPEPGVTVLAGLGGLSMILLYRRRFSLKNLV